MPLQPRKVLVGHISWPMGKRVTVARELVGDDLPAVLGGYRLSAAVCAMADLGVPDVLAERPVTVQALATALGVRPDLLGPLIDMLISHGALLRDAQGRLSNSGLSAQLVSGGTRDMVLGWSGLAEFFAAWASLAPAIRTGSSPFPIAHGLGFHDYLADHPARMSAYLLATGSTIEEFDQIAETLDLATTACLVCVGGGLGIELVPLMRRWPDLTAVLTDLPAALDGASELLLKHDIADRVRIEAGDARLSVPSGDRYLLVTVLRCLDDDAAVSVLASCRAAGGPHCAVHIVEMLQNDGPPQHPGATGSLTAWVAYGGADRTLARWRDIHHRAGLEIDAVTPLNDPYTLITSSPTPTAAASYT